MKTKDARMLIAAIARAVRERFTRRADHDALAARVATLEAALAEIRKHPEAA